MEATSGGCNNRHSDMRLCDHSMNVEIPVRAPLYGDDANEADMHIPPTIHLTPLYPLREGGLLEQPISPQMNVFGLWEEAVVPRKIPHRRGENMLMLTPPRKAPGDSRPKPSCCKVTSPPKKLKHAQFNSIYLHYYFNHKMWNDGAAITAVLCDAPALHSFCPLGTSEGH